LLSLAIRLSRLAPSLDQALHGEGQNLAAAFWTGKGEVNALVADTSQRALIRAVAGLEL